MANVGNPSKVILWSTPRSLSTVLTKCLSFVPESVIWFEPFISAMYYGTDARFEPLKSAEALADDKRINFQTQPTEVLLPSGVGYDATKCSYRWCQEQLESEYHAKCLVFVQAKCRAITTRFDAIPRGYRHSFLIRNPVKVLTSWKKATSEVYGEPLESIKLSTMPKAVIPQGYWFKETYDLYQHIKEKYDADPVIIDADDLLMNPGGILKAYCNNTGIPYSDDLLHWDPTDKIIKTWKVRRSILQLQQLDSFTMFDNAFNSCEFFKPSDCPDRDDLTEDDRYCIDFCMPYYESMYKERLIC